MACYGTVQVVLWLIGVVYDGVDIKCINDSCARDLNRRVSLLLVDDPTCGVRSGRSLKLVWFLD